MQAFRDLFPQNPEAFVTMVRPWDRSYEFGGRFYARPEHAPVAWVGDNRRDWVGLVDALDHMFRSAQAGYVIVGSDVGGYLDRNDRDFSQDVPFDTLVFARWTAAAALTPFMQLHGRANIAPWTVPDHGDETVALYRYWATLHDELVPFFDSLAEQAYAGGANLMRPVGNDPAAWQDDWRWMLGDAFLVAPIVDAGGTRDVALPAGSRWYDWWTPGGSALAGGQTLAGVAATRQQIPLYVREGAIVPLEVTNDATGLGTTASVGASTVLIWPASETTSFTVRDDDGGQTRITAARDPGGAWIELSRTPRPVVLRVRMDAAPVAVTRNGAPVSAAADRAAVLASGGDAWAYDVAERMLWVRGAAGAGSTVMTATNNTSPP